MASTLFYVISGALLRLVRAINGACVYAEDHWWGSANPDDAWFYKDVSSTLNRTPYLSSRPKVAIDPASSLFANGKNALIEGNIEQAIRNFSEIIEKHGDSEYARHALARLLNIYRRTGNPRYFVEYAIEVVRTHQLLKKTAMELMVPGLIAAKAFEQANALGEFLLNEESIDKEYVLYKLFTIMNRTRGRELNAKDYLALMNDKYPHSALTRDAQNLWQSRDEQRINEIIFSENENHNIEEVDAFLYDIFGDKLYQYSDKVEYEELMTFPNPFNPSTTIQFGLTDAGLVKIRIYDVLGREVATLVNEHLPAGMHQVVWNGSGQASGIYFVRMETAGFVQTRKAFLLK